MAASSDVSELLGIYCCKRVTQPIMSCRENNNPSFRTMQTSVTTMLHRMCLVLGSAMLYGD
jgi:hypothetical protein